MLWERTQFYFQRAVLHKTLSVSLCPAPFTHSPHTLPPKGKEHSHPVLVMVSQLGRKKSCSIKVRVRESNSFPVFESCTHILPFTVTLLYLLTILLQQFMTLDGRFYLDIICWFTPVLKKKKEKTIKLHQIPPVRWKRYFSLLALSD